MTESEREAAREHQAQLQRQRIAAQEQRVERHHELAVSRESERRSHRESERHLAEQAKLSQAQLVHELEIQDLPEKLAILFEARVRELALEAQRYRHELAIQREHAQLANDEEIRFLRNEINLRLIEYATRALIDFRFASMAAAANHRHAMEMEAFKRQFSNEHSVPIEVLNNYVDRAAAHKSAQDFRNRQP